MIKEKQIVLKISEDSETGNRTVTGALTVKDIMLLAGMICQFMDENPEWFLEGENDA